MDRKYFNLENKCIEGIIATAEKTIRDKDAIEREHEKLREKVRELLSHDESENINDGWVERRRELFDDVKELVK